MNAKYCNGQVLQLVHKGELCRARIVDMWQPAGKRNSHMYRVEMWPSDGGIVVEYYETAILTARIHEALDARWEAKKVASIG
jgi:hypothetical protein